MNKNDSLIINSSQSTLDKKKLSRLKIKKGIYWLLILIIVAGAGWFGYDRWHSDKLNLPKTRTSNLDQKESYKHLGHHSLQSDTIKASLMFERPWEFLYIDSPPDKLDPRFAPVFKSADSVIIDKSNSIEFGERIVKADRSYVFQSILAARIVPKSLQPKFSANAFFTQLINRLAFQDRGNLYKNTVTASWTGSKKFTNQYIKKNASTYDVSMALQKNLSTGIVDSVKGQLVKIQGKKADYYLLIVAIDKNWDSNSKTWQAIKDSIKVE